MSNYQIFAKMLGILCANYYTEQQIIQGFQNNTVMPKNGNFIIMRELPTHSISYPLYNFAGTLEDGTTQHSNINITRYQFDFYGVPSRYCCVGTRLYLQSQDGTNWLQAQNPQLSVYEVENMENLTQPLDQNNYLNRYMFRFSVFQDETIEYTNYAFNSVNPDLIYSSPQVIKE